MWRTKSYIYYANKTILIVLEIKEKVVYPTRNSLKNVVGKYTDKKRNDVD